MVLTSSKSRQRLFGLLLVIVLASNFMAYRLPFIPMPADSRGVVIGSLFDFAIVAPLLILAMTRKKGFTIKRYMTFMVLGLIAARFIIPAKHFEPFKFVPYVAIGLEGLILLAEVGLIILLVKHVPAILRDIKMKDSSGLFAFPKLLKEKVATHPIVSIIAAEALMFYYAFASWKQQPVTDVSKFYLHRKTSLIAFNVMLIHAIVIETIGIHWWLHDKSLVLSIVLLLFNVYTIVYLIADIQTVRLNPLSLDKSKIFISLGLGKRMEIPYDAIDWVITGEEATTYNIKEQGLIEFIARDFEVAKPHCIIGFNRPLKATLFLGIEKEFTTVALRVDEWEKFRLALNQKLE